MAEPTPPAAAQDGIGATIGYGDASGPLTAVVGILKITPAKRTVKDVNFTPLATGVVTHLPGSTDSDKIKYNLVYDATTYTTLSGMVGVPKYWTVTLGSDDDDEFVGFIDEIGLEEISPDNVVTIAVSIQTGAVAPAGA